jgi:hypothetical protein
MQHDEGDHVGVPYSFNYPSPSTVSPAGREASHFLPLDICSQLSMAESGLNVVGPCGECSLTTTSLCWAKAVEIFNNSLTSDDGKKISVFSNGDGSAFPEGAMFQELMDTAVQAAKSSEDDKSYARKKFDRIIACATQFSSAIDVLIQQHADTTAIVWGAIRMLIMVRFKLAFFFFIM